ncbi:uncharacterized protein LOC134209046 [Armigeres subalbatus]|uniref:uncharacterized protein LOC134209046 n=1 Tax=Armigeres subalbatus TaxID=124917 RepID=UPI002ED33C36
MFVFPKKLTQHPSYTAEVGGLPASRRLVISDKSSQKRFLIDFGSDVSIIPASKADRLSGEIPLVLHAANGSTIRTYGNKFYSIDLGLRRKYTWNFLVADVNIAIIGADFLAHHGLIIDLQNKCLRDNVTKLRSSGSILTAEVHGITSIEEHHPFRDLLHEFQESTVSTSFQQCRITYDVTHHIVTRGPPVANKARRMHSDKVKAAKEEFQIMIDLGI